MQHNSFLETELRHLRELCKSLQCENAKLKQNNENRCEGSDKSSTQIVKVKKTDPAYNYINYLKYKKNQ